MKALLLASMLAFVVGCASTTPPAAETQSAAAPAPGADVKVGVTEGGEPVTLGDLNIYAPPDHLMICFFQGPCTLWTEQELQGLAQDFFNKGVAAEKERASQGGV